MAISALCSWIRNGSPELRAALITDVSWWEESQTVLTHQFLILRFDLGGTLYDMKIERVGKVIASPTRQAIDRATITRAAAFDEAFYKAHSLLLALLTHHDLVPKSSFVSDAFVDFLDYKWAGPPARLGDLPRYFEVVNGQVPSYSLVHGNCYWFARLLFHTIALRHYAFPLVASRIAPRELYVPIMVNLRHYEEGPLYDNFWRRHDPSSTGLVFRYIDFQYWRNSTSAFYRILLKVTRYRLVLLIAGGAFIAFIAVAVALFVFRKNLSIGQSPVGLPTSYTHLAEVAVGLSMIWVFVGAMWGIPHLRVIILHKKVEQRAESILRTLDEGADPEGIRGAYIPCKLPVVEMPKRILWLHKRHPVLHWFITPGKWRPITISSRERELPTPWKHEKQIYAPLKDEYLASFEALRQQAFFRGARLTCHFHPM
ncbi:hypothetical protein C8F01DRAFT_1257647 [Mycena amicta]|nr:hypothetical protein C8F01DRAFT_1257647 [Mycena amicta]